MSKSNHAPLCAEHWITVSKKGVYQGAASGFPCQQLKHNQIAVTPEEFRFLSKVDYSEAKEFVQSIARKIKKAGAHGS